MENEFKVVNTYIKCFAERDYTSDKKYRKVYELNNGELIIEQLRAGNLTPITRNEFETGILDGHK